MEEPRTDHPPDSEVSSPLRCSCRSTRTNVALPWGIITTFDTRHQRSRIIELEIDQLPEEDEAMLGRAADSEPIARAGDRTVRSLVVAHTRRATETVASVRARLQQVDDVPLPRLQAFLNATIERHKGAPAPNGEGGKVQISDLAV
jgi:hypothetical protein